MSFRVPQNIPDLSTSARSLEDYVYSKTSEILGSNGSTFGTRAKDELPMFKDKPIGASYSEQRSKNRRRALVCIVALLIGIVFFSYRVSSDKNGENTTGVGNSGGAWFSLRGKNVWKERQEMVRQAFLESWNGYEQHAFGKDIYAPISKSGKNMGPDGLGWIIVDCIDTMMIMKLDDQVKVARDWIANNLTYDMDYSVNTFETTIRMLGGLLSAHFLSNYDDVYLEKAVDLANRLIGAFDTPSGIPYASVNLGTSEPKRSHADQGSSSTAEAASLQLEFKYLSKLTGEAMYWEKAEKVIEVIDKNNAVDGLVPIFINADTGRFHGNQIRLGSRGDSYYEYLLKMYLQTNNQEPVYRNMYDESMDGVKKRLIQKSKPSGFTFVAELDNGIDGPLSPKMDHLVCFLPGNLALGATEGRPLQVAQRLSWSLRQASDMKLARELTKTCMEMYKVSETGIAPEIVYFNTEDHNAPDIKIKAMDAHNLQRPETVESLFIMWRITKDPIYREWGWQIFEAFYKYARLEDGSGYTSLGNVKKIPAVRRDDMESFWLAETLKYLYLLFEDDDSILDLEKVVFNTEAHPFAKFNMAPLFRTGWARPLKTNGVAK
ncbi:glycoside hydrolase [Dipodascopsis uninucleata]